jgi:hypothetical protein
MIGLMASSPGDLGHLVEPLPWSSEIVRRREAAVIGIRVS